MRIIIDAMGGDNAPDAVIDGVLLASKECKCEFTLCGHPQKIGALLSLKAAEFAKIKNRITILPCSEVIDGHDKPVKAIRQKKDSSLVRGLCELKAGNGDAFISAGNTGALLAGSIFILGRMKNVERPAIGIVYPCIGAHRPAVLIDGGANAEVKAKTLHQFAIMGELYYRSMFEQKNAPAPRVGLINVGAEPTKGTATMQEAYDLLEKAAKKKKLHFVGNVEARDIPYGAADVLVCDGVIGNVLIKLTEGLAMAVFGALKEKFLEDFKSKLGAALLLPKLKGLKNEFDYEEYGGAPILGLTAPVLKAHGSAEKISFKNVILQTEKFVKSGINKKIAKNI